MHTGKQDFPPSPPSPPSIDCRLPTVYLPNRGNGMTAIANRLRIAQVAPLAERVPPRKYGGTERVVAALTDELVRRGHEVTLFASGDSETLARLEAIVPVGLRLMPGTQMPRDHYPALMAELGQVYARAGEFDLIHNHNDYFAFPLAHLSNTPTLTTLHGRLDLPTLPVIYTAYPKAPVNSISMDQRYPLPQAHWVGNVYNGVDLSHFTMGDGSGGYFAFLGRISSDKGIAQAIEIARRTGIPLKIAAKIDDDQPDYYDWIKEDLNGPLVEWIGEISEHDKSAFLGNARALLFPVQWPEPFGLALAEAMACGTPVLATAYGAVPEVVVNGVTGFVCATTDALVAAACRLDEVSRHACRAHVEAHFSASTMTTGYERLYRQLIGARTAMEAPIPRTLDAEYARDTMLSIGE